MCRAEVEVRYLQRNNAPPGRQELPARHPAAPGRLDMQSSAMLPEVCSNCPGSVAPVGSLNAQHGRALAQEGAARNMRAHAACMCVAAASWRSRRASLARQKPAPASLNSEENLSHLPISRTYCANKIRHSRTVTSASPKNTRPVIIIRVCLLFPAGRRSPAG